MMDITQAILQNSEFLISLIAVFIAAISAYAAIKNIHLSRISFQRTTTLQTEIFILNAYKEYVGTMYDKNASDEYRQEARTQFLMAIDLYCKYVINGHLDKKLSDDNLHFFLFFILAFRDIIKNDIQNYNNIADYVKKYNISLD